jgi:hypothetical protein
MSRLALCVAVLCGLCLGGTAIGASAVAVVVPYDVQIPLVLKALTYDRNLKTRVVDHVRIALLAPPGGNRDAVEELFASLDALPARSIDGLPVSFKEIAWTDEESFDRALRGARWAAVYALPGFSTEQLAQIRRTGQARRVLLVGAAEADVERGMAFGVGASAGRPLIVVNLSSTRACGSEFDLALLRLARVIQ